MLSDKLINLRRKQGFSQQDVAARLGVSRQTISNWEAGQGAPALDKAVMLARLYGISLDDLAGDEVEVVSPCDHANAPSDSRIPRLFAGAHVELMYRTDYGVPETIRGEVLDVTDEWLRLGIDNWSPSKEGGALGKKRRISLVDLESVLFICADGGGADVVDAALSAAAEKEER